MKNKINVTIYRYFAVAIIGLISFSGAYSFSNGNNNKKTKKNDAVKTFDVVKVADAPMDVSISNDEEILMKELMKRISRDYKTTNITIAIDDVQIEKISAGKAEFIGKGEVKIGELVWNTINFDVVLDENKKPSKIVYEIKE